LYTTQVINSLRHNVLIWDGYMLLLCC